MGEKKKQEKEEKKDKARKGIGVNRLIICTK